MPARRILLGHSHTLPERGFTFPERSHTFPERSRRDRQPSKMTVYVMSWLRLRSANI